MSGVLALRLRNSLLWPALITAGMVSLTLFLGVWQVERLAWKTELLASIDRGEASPPVELTDTAAPFSRVKVRGHLLPLAALYGAEVRATDTGAAMGGQLVQPLTRVGAPAVMLDLGWVPEGTAPLDATDLQIVGYVRPPEHPIRFGAKDDPATHRFYALDPAAIGRSLGLDTVAPFTIVALGPDRPGVFPAPALSLPRPVNNHLSYAVTWFGMAIAGLVIFTVYARKSLRP